VQFDCKKTIPESTSEWLGAFSDPGKRYGDLNQDSFMYCKSGKNCHVIAVCDGHGINGEVGSKIAACAFKEFFESHPIFESSVQQSKSVISDGFKFAHQKIVDEYPFLSTITYNGNTFELDNIKGLSMYKNIKEGVLLQDFGTTATVVAIKTKKNDKITRTSTRTSITITTTTTTFRRCR